MTSQYLLLYYANKHLLCKQIIDDMERAVARSDKKIKVPASATVCAFASMQKMDGVALQ